MSGAEPDSLRSEEDTFQRLEKDLYRGIRRVLRGKKISLQQLGQILYPRSPAVDLSKRRSLHSLTLPRRRLLTDYSNVESGSSIHSKATPDTSPARKHLRYKSDISELLKDIKTEEENGTQESEQDSEQDNEQLLAARALSQQSVDTIKEDTEKEVAEDAIQNEDEVIDSKKQKKDTLRQQSEPLIPSIDIEINVTISIDCGSIVLHSEDIG